MSKEILSPKERNQRIWDQRIKGSPWFIGSIKSIRKSYGITPGGFQKQSRWDNWHLKMKQEELEIMDKLKWESSLEQAKTEEAMDNLNLQLPLNRLGFELRALANEIGLVWQLWGSCLYSFLVTNHGVPPKDTFIVYKPRGRNTFIIELSTTAKHDDLVKRSEEIRDALNSLPHSFGKRTRKLQNLKTYRAMYSLRQRGKKLIEIRDILKLDKYEDIPKSIEDFIEHQVGL